MTARRDDVKQSMRRLEQHDRLSLALNEIDARLHSKFDIDEIMQGALDDFVATLNADAGDIKVRDADGWVVTYQNGFGSRDVGLRLPERDAPVAAQVYGAREPVIVTDYSKEPTLDTGFPLTHKLTATLAVPLIVRDEVVGALFAQMTTGPREFTDIEVDFAVRMAASVSLALDNARLLNSERTRVAHIEALNEVATLTVSALEPREAARRALDYVVDHLGISAAAAWQKADDATMKLIASANFPQAYVDSTQSLSLDAPLDNVMVAVTGEPVVAESLAEWNPAAQERFAELGASVGAYAIVPIISKNGVIGVLGFTWPEPRPIPKEDVDFYVALAGQLGLALENARLFEAEKRELARTQLLQDLTLSAATETDPRAVAKAAIAALQRHLGMRTGDVRALDDERQELVLLASWGVSVDIAKRMARLPVAAVGALAPKALRAKRFMTHEDEDLTPERVALLEQSGAAADRYIQLPLIYQDRAVGTFGLTFNGRRSFTQDETALYQVVAGIVAQAVENARLFQAERLRAGRMEVLRDVSELVASSLDPAQVIATGLASAVEHIGVRAASIWLMEEAGILRLAGANGFPEQFFADFVDGLTVDAPFDVARAVRTGEPVIHADAAVSDVSANVIDAYRRYGIPLGALIVVPLRIGADVIGALTLAWEEPRRFDSDALAFDVSLANTFSTALANARLFEDVREQGNRITEIINSMSDAFVTVDHEWRYTIVNPPAAAMLGRSADDLVGKRMDEEFPEVAGWPYYRKAMEEQVPVSFESYAEMANTWVEVHAYPTLDGISMYVSDITERKAAEASLERLNRLLDAHISNSPLAVVEFDSDFCIIRWSDGAERMFGWAAEEVLGKAMTDLKWIYEEDAMLVERESEGLSSGETARSFNTNRNYCKDGSVLWCEWYDSAIYDEDGGLVSIFSQILDVTDRREAEEALRNALAEVAGERTRLRQIIDEIPVGVAVLGPKGAVLEVNDALDRIWAGVKPKADSADGFAAYEGYRHGTDERMKPKEWPGPRAIKSRRPESGLIDFARLDHTTGVIRVTALPIINEAGELTRVVVITEEVTEQIDAQRLAAALNEISLEVSSTLEEGEILQRLASSGREALRTQSAAAVVWRDRGWVVEAGVEIPEELIGRTLRDSDAQAMQAVFEQTEPVVASDAQQDPRVMGGKLAELGAKSVIALPLISHGKNAGAIFFWRTGHRRDFSEAQLEFARKLMTIATLALDNARLYEREHHIAEMLQEAILTPPEPVDGLDIAYIYRPASRTADVGGDFYEVVTVEHDRIGFVVGDVSGKGIDAARFTTLMTDGARAFLLEGDDPGRVLERLNSVVWRSTPIERFATAFLGVLEVSTGSLAYSGAGHPSALVLGSDGVRLLASSAGLLGAWDGLSFKSSENVLAPGEVIVMYTDGVTEARRSGELFGEERLVATLEGLAATPLNELPDALLNAVLEFSGGTLRDDIVILCLARRP